MTLVLLVTITLLWSVALMISQVAKRQLKLIVKCQEKNVLQKRMIFQFLQRHQQVYLVLQVSISYISSSLDSHHPLCSRMDPPSFLFIQMQLCQKETMKDWLHNNIHNRQRAVILNHFEQVRNTIYQCSFHNEDSFQILDAVVYVHSKSLMHRDLKVIKVVQSVCVVIKTHLFSLQIYSSHWMGVLKLETLVQSLVMLSQILIVTRTLVREVLYDIN